MTCAWCVLRHASEVRRAPSWGLVIMAGVAESRRGVVAGLLTLSRNLGLITGAAVMGAVFLHATGVRDLATAGPDDVAAGMRTTLAVAALLMTAALALTLGAAARAPGARSRIAPAAPVLDASGSCNDSHDGGR